MGDVLGAILAGGRSSRMGRDKALLRLHDGRTMIEHVAAALRDVTESDRIAIVGGDSNIIDVLASHGFRPAGVADVREPAGPLGGVEALLRSGLAEQYLVCPCDVPAITVEVLRMLLKETASPASVLRISGRERFEPLPARIAARAVALPVVTRLLDEDVRSMWRLMEELPAAIIDIDAAHAGALRNVNTPDDLSTA